MNATQLNILGNWITFFGASLLTQAAEMEAAGFHVPEDRQQATFLNIVGNRLQTVGAFFLSLAAQMEALSDDASLQNNQESQSQQQAVEGNKAPVTRDKMDVSEQERLASGMPGEDSKRKAGVEKIEHAPWMTGKNRKKAICNEASGDRKTESGQRPILYAATVMPSPNTN